MEHHSRRSTSKRGNREPESLDRIIDRWLRAQRTVQRIDRDAVHARWNETVGERIAAHTRVTGFRSGILQVDVDSAALLQELSTYYRAEILESLKGVEEFRSVRDIRFRTGSL